MTTIVDGTTGITFPSTISGVSPTQQYSGRVLQVVSFSNGTQLASSSTSWVATALTASITPTASTSKILIMALGGSLDNNPGTNAQCYLSIFRNSSTNLGNATSGMVQIYTSGSTRVQAPASLGYVDSPATTSATTYTVYLKTNGASTMYYNVDATISTMVLQEIAA
jgi:hypothetical protein